MQDQWYGDKRDLVKWGTLLELARQFGLKHILQVAYYRKHDWGEIEIDGKSVPVPPAVLRHFRNSVGIHELTSDPAIEVIEQEFLEREEYLKTVQGRIEDRKVKPGIVFLDPDTGLEPTGKVGFQHVLGSELKSIWDSLRTKDLLVLYQHKTNRNKQPWIPVKQKQFADVLGVQARLAYAREMAHDVAFFFAQKI